MEVANFHFKPVKLLMVSQWSLHSTCTVKPVLRDHCHERQPVLKDPIFLAKVPTGTLQFHWTCHQRPPVLRDHIFMLNGAVFQDRFTCYMVRNDDIQLNRCQHKTFTHYKWPWLDLSGDDFFMFSRFIVGYSMICIVLYNCGVSYHPPLPYTHTEFTGSIDHVW